MANPAFSSTGRPLPTEALRRVALGMTLRGCQLFAGLPAADVEEIAAFVRVKSLEKDASLFREGDPSEGFYIVQRGAVNVHKVNAAGKEQVIHVFRPGEPFAEASLASPTGYPANARALEPSTVLLVPKAEVLALLAKRPDLALRMLGSMSQHLRVLVSLLDDLTLKNVETRLANWLVKRCPSRVSKQPAAIKLTMTKRVLAAELGTTAETLSRTLARFRDLGLVGVRGATITVKSPVALAELLRRNLGEA